MRAPLTALEIVKAVLILIAIAIGCVVLYLIQSLILYFMIASILTLIGRRVVLFFRIKLKMNNILASALTLFLIVMIFSSLFALLFPFIANQSKNLAMLDYENLQNSLQKLGEQVGEVFGASPKVVEEIIEASTTDESNDVGGSEGYAIKLISYIFRFLGDFGIGLFSTLFITFFMLKDSKLIQRAVLKLIPLKHHTKTLHSFAMVKDLLSRYFIGVVFQILILFSIYSITLLLVGVESAILIAFLCSIFNIIPYIGPIIGAILMVIFTLMQFSDFDFIRVAIPAAGYVSLGIIIGQLVDNFFSQPFIFSSSVKSHPLEIFTIIIIAGLLFGPFGMMAAVPIYTVIKIFLKEFWPENRLVKFITKDL